MQVQVNEGSVVVITGSIDGGTTVGVKIVRVIGLVVLVQLT